MIANGYHPHRQHVKHEHLQEVCHKELKAAKPNRFLSTNDIEHVGTLRDEVNQDDVEDLSCTHTHAGLDLHCAPHAQRAIA